MVKFLLPEKDGLPVRISGPWVREKLFFVKQYIDTFEIAMRQKPWRKRIYIDLFAGPGKCLIKGTQEYLLGSPLLAVTTQYPFTDYFFVDSDDANINVLRKRIEPVSSAKCFTGDANLTVDNIVTLISRIDAEFIKGAWSSLNLAFLDPEGLELDWNTIATLAKLKKMDLIIHYSQHGINRLAKNCYKSDSETIVDKFFGDFKWREIYARNLDKGIHLPLMNHYKSKLSELGYIEIKDNEEIWTDAIKNRKNAPLYRLLFASKDSLGIKFWDHIRKTNVYGQTRLPNL
jgi:three-Cys-motif partner protein